MRSEEMFAKILIYYFVCVVELRRAFLLVNFENTAIGRRGRVLDNVARRVPHDMGLQSLAKVAEAHCSIDNRRQDCDEAERRCVL